MQAIYQAILFQPLFNVFVSLYNLVPDTGVVILLFTVLVKLVLYPVTASSIKAQQSLTALQPKINEIKEKNKGDDKLIASETMKLYQEHKVNPLGSCLPLLLQLPIFIALYQVLQSGLANNKLNLLYSFVHNPGAISTVSLGFFNLVNPNIPLAVAAGIAQFFQAKSMSMKRPPKSAGEGAKDEDMATIMNRQALYIMPVMTVIIGIQFPAGLTLYWLLSTLLAIAQQAYIVKKQTVKPA